MAWQQTFTRKKGTPIAGDLFAAVDKEIRVKGTLKDR